MTNTHEHHELQEQKAIEDKTMLGFWIYLMTDCILFSSLFATYAVLHGNTAGGPSGTQIFDLHFVLIETLVLLTSSFTCGLAMLITHHARKVSAKVSTISAWLCVTFVLGAIFLAMELTEFSRLIADGTGPQTSGFLSAYFSLVGLHGLHIFVGLIWIVTLLVYLWKRGLTPNMRRKLSVFGLYWHFLDLVWIFIFTIVYLYAHI